MTQQAKTQKQVHIIARYFLKKSGIVCYAVRSSNGTDIYRTCVSNGRASCTCPGFERFHKCYHATQILTIEASRKEASRITPDFEVAAERADYLEITGQTTESTISHIEADANRERQAAFAALKQQYDFRSYDIVGEAQRIVNAEIVSQKVGDSYEQVGDPRIEMSERDAEATRRINFELGMGY